MVIARSLGAKDYGTYSLLLMWVTITQILINSGITLGAQRFVAQARARHQTEVAAAVARRLSVVQSYKLGAALLVVAVALPLFGRTGGLQLTAGVVALVLASTLFRTRYIFNTSVCKGAGDFRSVAIIVWIGSGANLLFVLTAGAFAQSMPAFLAAYMLSNLVFWLASARASRRYLQQVDNSVIPEAVRQDLSRHLRIVTVSTILSTLASSQIEVFLLGIWSNTENVGFFRLGHMLAGGVIGLVSGVLSAVVLPHLSRALAEGSAEGARTYLSLTRYLIVLSVPVVVLLSTLSNMAVVLVYGAEFEPAAIVLCAMLVAFAVEDINAPAQAYLLGAGKQYTLLGLTVFALVLKATLGVALIFHFGLAGAVLSYLGGIAVIAAVRIRIVRTEMNVNFPMSVGLRALLVAIVAAIPVYVMTRIAPTVLTAVLGAGLFSVVYAVGILRYRFLTPSELTDASRLCGRLPVSLRRAALWVLRCARTM